ncbi:MAG: GNAT family N-acetyltransferase [Pseudomonas sp.]|uniref:GNAT family N-acetyltransferase n=1 Tax=Pseudomonas sp. TaxID=306 RepID=UPI00398296E5
MHYRLLPPPLKPLADKFYRAQRSPMRASAGAQIWVAEQQEIVAALCLQTVNGGHWLTSLLVAPAQRRQGLAAHLIETALTECSAPVWLFCHPELSDFYLRQGFTLANDMPAVLADRLLRYQRSKRLLAFSRHPG